MSIILKGIDVPKDGEWLEVIIKPTKEVIVDTIRYRDNALLKTEYESAIQIPKEHGKLIDVNKLYPSILEKLEYGGSDGRMVYRKKFQAYTEKDIENAPTILGVEE